MTTRLLSPQNVKTIRFRQAFKQDPLLYCYFIDKQMILTSVVLPPTTHSIDQLEKIAHGFYSLV